MKLVKFTSKEVAIALIIFVVFILLSSVVNQGGSDGFPLTFYAYGPIGGTYSNTVWGLMYFSLHNLVINIIFWFVLSSVLSYILVTLYKKIKTT